MVSGHRKVILPGQKSFMYDMEFIEWNNANSDMLNGTDLDILCSAHSVLFKMTYCQNPQEFLFRE